MTYHKQKMEEINISIRELWRDTYRGNGVYNCASELVYEFETKLKYVPFSVGHVVALDSVVIYI